MLWLCSQIKLSWFIGLLILQLANCGCARHTVAPEPVQVTRPLPVSVKREAWSGIVETLMQGGDQIDTAQRQLGRVTLTHILTEDNFQQLCNVRNIRDFDVDAFRLLSGAIKVAVWLDGEKEDKAPIKLQMEARCYLEFEHRWNRFIVFPIGALIAYPAMILTAGDVLKRPLAVVASTGEFERELQVKILTTLGVDLPPWLVN